MYISTFSLLQLLPVVLASPLPQGLSAALGSSVTSLPGVNITNGFVAKTADVVKNSYIVVLRESAPVQAIDKFESKVLQRLGQGLRNTYRIDTTEDGSKGFSAVQVTTDKKGLEDIAKDPSVAFVELDAFASVAPIRSKPNAASASSSKPSVNATGMVSRPGTQWGLGRISHRLKGDSTYVSDDSACAGTRIYVLDTGVRASHEQFRGTKLGSKRAFIGANFVDGQPMDDENGHGTHCAATAAGWTTGVCRQATIISVKVLGKDGRGSYSGIISGIQWAAKDAINKGARYKSVLSISLGGSYSEAVNAAVQSVINSGLTVVVAAGNANTNAINTSPASSPNAITVGATDSNDQRAWFSNYGSVLDVFAPGVDIYSAWAGSDNDYAWLDGTSQATPHVAGLAAYIMIKEKISGVAAVRDRIISRSGKDLLTDVMGSFNRIANNGSGK